MAAEDSDDGCVAVAPGAAWAVSRPCGRSSTMSCGRSSTMSCAACATSWGSRVPDSVVADAMETKQRPEHLRGPEAGSGSAASQPKRGASSGRLGDDLPSDRATELTKL